MNKVDVTDFEGALKRIRAQAAAENIRITQHGQQGMVEEDITLDEVLEAVAAANFGELP